MIPVVKAKLLEAKKGLIVGIANEQSIAWGCAKAFRALGAELAVTYLNDKAKKFVEPLARELEAPILMPLDVRVPGQMEAVFERITKDWGRIDFVVHSIAFSPKDALQGRVVDVPREGFLTTMEVSCWTFIRMAHLAEPLMRKGGTLFTVTYYGSQMVVKNYNIMGVAKAALESAVRYMAAELGPKGIRVHAISPGPLATQAASGIPEFDELLDKGESEGAGAQPCQHRRCRHSHRVPRARRSALDHRRDPLHRRRLPHHRLARLGSERQPRRPARRQLLQSLA
jgi:enoyl-[acyl-carrier protein] reductase I